MKHSVVKSSEDATRTDECAERCRSVFLEFSAPCLWFVYCRGIVSSKISGYTILEGTVAPLMPTMSMQKMAGLGYNFEKTYPRILFAFLMSTFPGRAISKMWQKRRSGIQFSTLGCSKFHLVDWKRA